MIGSFAPNVGIENARVVEVRATDVRLSPRSRPFERLVDWFGLARYSCQVPIFGNSGGTTENVFFALSQLAQGFIF